MLNKLLNLFRFKDEITPNYGWSIFALDDSIHLTRRVLEEQRKQMQQLL
jgi:hypothetical protein